MDFDGDPVAKIDRLKALALDGLGEHRDFEQALDEAQNVTGLLTILGDDHDRGPLATSKVRAPIAEGGKEHSDQSQDVGLAGTAAAAQPNLGVAQRRRLEAAPAKIETPHKTRGACPCPHRAQETSPSCTT